MLAVDLRTYEFPVAAPFANGVAAQVTMTVNPLSDASVRFKVVLAAQLPLDALVRAPFDARLRGGERARFLESS